MDKKAKTLLGVAGAVIVALGAFLGVNTSQNTAKLAEKESEIQRVLDEKDEAVASKESELAAKDEAAEQKESELAEIQAKLDEKLELIESLESELEEQKASLEEKTAETSEGENELSETVAGAADAVKADAENAEEGETETEEVPVMSAEEIEALEEELIDLKEQVEIKESEFAEQIELAAEQAEISEQELEEKQQLLEQQEAEFTAKTKELEEELEQILGVRSKIISELQDKFKDSDLKVVVDDETGVISLDTNVLFGFGSSDLTDEGIALLEKFFPQYIEVLSSDDVKDYISEIIIEGHTDDIGSYLYNLYLSQKRAFSVAEYCLEDDAEAFTDEQLEELRSMVTANGRAYYDPILDKNGEMDDEASRRVEVRFRLFSDDLLQQAAYPE